MEGITAFKLKELQHLNRRNYSI